MIQPSDEIFDRRKLRLERLLRRLTFGFLAFAGASLLIGLDYPLIDRTETRVAEISREMLVTNDWTTLRLNFQPYYDKPPLLYWLCGLSFKVFGANEFAARLFPTLASFLTLVCTVFFASRWFGPKVGLLSGVILFLSGGFVVLSRFVATDSLLALFTCLTAFTGYEAIRALSSAGSLGESERQAGVLWMAACGASCGFGFLSKGPVIGVLCGVPFLFSIFVLNKRKKFRWRSVSWSVFAFSCVAGPWLVWVAIYDPQYLNEFLLRHNVSRFGGEFHSKPFWFFIPILLAGAHPWSFMTIPMLTQLFSRDRARKLLLKPTIYLVVSGLWCVLFFSLSSCKLPTYILPAAAPLSIVTGAFLAAVLNDKPQFVQKRFAQLASPQMATWATILGVIAFMIFSPFQMSSIETWFLGVALAIIVALTDGAATFFAHSSPKRSWLVTAFVAFGLSLLLSHSVIPSYAVQISCRSHFADGSDPSFPSDEFRIVTLVEQFPDVPFYSCRNDIHNFPAIDEACIHEIRSGKEPIVMYVPRRFESAFLTYDFPDLQRVFTNTRYSVYQRATSAAENVADRARTSHVR